MKPDFTVLPPQSFGTDSTQDKGVVFHWRRHSKAEMSQKLWFMGSRGYFWQVPMRMLLSMQWGSLGVTIPHGKSLAGTQDFHVTLGSYGGHWLCTGFEDFMKLNNQSIRDFRDLVPPLVLLNWTRMMWCLITCGVTAAHKGWHISFLMERASSSASAVHLLGAAKQEFIPLSSHLSLYFRKPL